MVKTAYLTVLFPFGRIKTTGIVRKRDLPWRRKEHIMNMEAVMTSPGLTRDARGRFVTGQSGNPAGKVPGTRNRATLLRAALDGEEGAAMARMVIDKALSGDVVAAKFCLGRLEPMPRSRAIELDLPEGARARDIVAAFDVTVRAMASGEITPDEAVQVTRVLDGRLRAIEAAVREEARHARGAASLKKPSPSGRGLGEGMGHSFDGAGIASARRPHPAPLPRGEGGMKAGEGGAGLDADSLIPHPPFARSRFGRDHLHSTCISRAPPLAWPGSPSAADWRDHGQALR
jgi:hypothetical protein